MHNFIHTGPARLSNLSSINHFEMEARVGIEPTNAAFAEPCLTTWRPRLRLLPLKPISLSLQRKFRFYAFFAVSRLNPKRSRFGQRSAGLNIPSGVMMPVISSGGVTSNPGLRAALAGLATRT